MQLKELILKYIAAFNNKDFKIDSIRAYIG